MIDPLYRRLGRTNELLCDLGIAMRALTSALTTNTQEEKTLVATLSDLTAVVTQLSADDSALKTSLDALVTAYNAAKNGGFTPEQQAALDAAVTDLQTAHADLVADAQEATEAVTPPPP